MMLLATLLLVVARRRLQVGRVLATASYRGGGAGRGRRGQTQRIVIIVASASRALISLLRHALEATVRADSMHLAVEQQAVAHVKLPETVRAAVRWMFKLSVTTTATE